MVEAKLKYHILPGSGVTFQKKVFQAFCVDDKYLYAIQLNATDLKTNYLRRGLLPTDGSNNVYMTETMTLQEFGHTQTLSLNTYNGHTYLWIGMNNATDKIGDNYWATQLGRVEFKNGATLKYTECKRLVTLIKANKDASSPFTMVRADGALSTTPTGDREDKGKQRLMFITGSSTSATAAELQFSCYNIDTINKLLDEATGNYISCADLTTHVVSAYTQKPGVIPFPNGSWQGLEFSDANSVYIAGGKTGQTLKIVKGDWRFTTSKTISLSGISEPTQAEIEGLQIKGSEILVGIEVHGGSTHPHNIYTIPKSSF